MRCVDVQLRVELKGENARGTLESPQKLSMAFTVVSVNVSISGHTLKRVTPREICYGADCFVVELGAGLDTCADRVNFPIPAGEPALLR